MAKFQTFFYVLKKSFTSPAWYSDLLSAKFSFSLKYFFLFFFFYSVIGTAIFSAVFIPEFAQKIKNLPAQFESIYPSELEITIKNGEVSTNVEEPYQIPVERLIDAFSDKVLGSTSWDTNDIENLIVIDTSASSGADNFPSYRTAVLVNKKSISVLDDDGAIRTYPLGAEINLVINKILVSEVIAKVSPYLNYIVPIVISFIFFSLLIFIPVSYLFYLLFFALVLMLFSKIVKPELSYDKSYQLGLHMCTLHAALFGILGLFKVSLPIPFLRTILLLVFSYFVLKSIKTPASPTPPSVPVNA